MLLKVHITDIFHLHDRLYMAFVIRTTNLNAFLLHHVLAEQRVTFHFRFKNRAKWGPGASDGVTPKEERL